MRDQAAAAAPIDQNDCASSGSRLKGRAGRGENHVAVLKELVEFCGRLAYGRSGFVKSQIVAFRCHANGFKIGTLFCNEESLIRPWWQRKFWFEPREIDSIVDDRHIVYGCIQITRNASRTAFVDSNISSYAGDRGG